MENGPYLSGDGGGRSSVGREKPEMEEEELRSVESSRSSLEGVSAGAALGFAGDEGISSKGNFLLDQVAGLPRSTRCGGISK